ncbi:MAG: ABC transporter permease [Candidatus Altiarchaeota archaeon]|nr:ABC transporter permease [Candidatus Altiarchaeota archaeon]
MNVFNGIFGERIFKAATLSALIFFILFLVGIVVSMICYISSDRFISILFSKEIIFAIKLSLITATIAVLISVAIGIPAAYALSQTEFWGKDIIDTILDLPIVISPIALGAALLIFFSTPIGSGIEEHGIKFVFVIPGIILAQFVVVSALCIRLMKSTFDAIGSRYEDVARTLGCNKFQALFKVTLPLAKNGLLAAGILTWARAIGEFGATVTLAGATAMKTETLPIAIFLSLASADVEKAIAVILILIIISITSLFAIRKIAGSGWSI